VSEHLLLNSSGAYCTIGEVFLSKFGFEAYAEGQWYAAASQVLIAPDVSGNSFEISGVPCNGGTLGC
jgi:hypothetical protein